jgi:hypothetical protein
VCAVRRDDVATVDLNWSGHSIGRHRDPIVILAHPRHLVSEADVGARQLAQHPLQKLHQLPLLTLNAIWVVGFARQQREIEGRNRTRFAVSELPGRGLEADLDHPRDDLELVQQIERRGMKS